MKKWEELEKRIQGIGLSEAICSFFEYTKRINADSATVTEGIDYLVGSGRPIMAAFIVIKRVLEKLPDEYRLNSDFSPVIKSYGRIRELIKDGAGRENGEQVLGYFSELAREYPLAFAILDENSGIA